MCVGEVQRAVSDPDGKRDVLEDEGKDLWGMCGVTLKHRQRSQDLLERLGIVGVAERVRRGRLRWFGHVERKNADDWVKKCREMVVEGSKSRGRNKKTWMECVEGDMLKLGLSRVDAQDRERWRRGI